jgi:hypothetical protein
MTALILGAIGGALVFGALLLMFGLCRTAARPTPKPPSRDDDWPRNTPGGWRT